MITTCEFITVKIKDIIPTDKPTQNNIKSGIFESQVISIHLHGIGISRTTLLYQS